MITSRRAAELAGITFRKLDYWCRIGAITPTVEADGSGSRRGFTVDDVLALRLISLLRDAGVDLDPAAAVARTLLELPAEDRPLCLLVDGSGRIYGPDDKLPPFVYRIDLSAPVLEPEPVKYPASPDLLAPRTFSELRVDPV